MTEEELKEELNKANSFRPDDILGRHNFFSRAISLSLVILMLGGLIASFYGITLSDVFWSSVIWASASVAIIYTIGANSLDKVLEILAKIKDIRNI